MYQVSSDAQVAPMPLILHRKLFRKLCTPLHGWTARCG